jgi:hypothetical protein
MRFRQFWIVLLAIGCSQARKPALEPDFKSDVWRIRLQADSTPTRTLPRKPVDGTIDFSSSLSDVDFRSLIGRSLSRRAEVKVERDSSLGGAAAVYRVILGEVNTDVGKIVLVAKAIRTDSLAGTWSETVLCCSAAGTFVMWRASR